MSETFRQNSREIRQAWRQLLTSQRWDFWITLNFNRHTSLEAAKAKLREFDARLNRGMLGKNWQKKPQDQRVQFVAFPEHPDSNIHYHALIRVPEPSWFKSLADKHWVKLVPGGQVHITTPPTGQDWINVAWYSAKWTYQSKLMEHIVLSGEFTSGRT